jgi:hypothetical protein
VKPSVLLRLAVAGNRTDLLRTVLTALSASLATVSLLAAATVLAIRGDSNSGDPARYTNDLLNQSGLRPGVATTLILLSLPILALAGQCIRLGAPARDRRLAAMRLAGATPGQAVLIATAETAASSALGSVAGLVAYEIGRPLLDHPDHRGRLGLPVDVRLPALVLIAIVLFVPIIAAVVGALLMRRVIVTPLGVVRRLRERGPRPWPGVMLVAGLLLFGGLREVAERTEVDGPVFYLCFGLGVTLTMLGVVLGTGWISAQTGTLLRRLGPWPSTLLAGRQLAADPWNGSRTLAAMFTAVIAGSITLGFDAWIATDVRGSKLTDGNDAHTNPGFYFGATRLLLIAVAVGIAIAAAGVLIALAEQIVSRRRTYASLAAAGVPRRTLALAVLWQTVTPLVPALALALASGAGLARILFGSTWESAANSYDICVDGNADPATCVTRHVVTPHVLLSVPVPFERLLLLGGGALAAVVLVAGAGLLVLRSSTDLEELRV